MTEDQIEPICRLHIFFPALLAVGGALFIAVRGAADIEAGHRWRGNLVIAGAMLLALTAFSWLGLGSNPWIFWFYNWM
jgi:hypothetical protein